MAQHRKHTDQPTTPRPVLGHQRPWAEKLPLWPRGSIRARLQFSHLLASLLPLLALGFLLLYNSAQSERRVVEQTQISVANSIALDIDNTIGKYDSELLLFGRRLRLTTRTQRLIEADVKEHVDRRFPEIIELTVVGLDGQEIARVSQDRVFPEAELINRRTEPFFDVATQGLIHHQVIQSRDGRKMVQIAVPARNGIGQVVGGIVANVTTQTIEQRLQELPRDTGRSTFVIDSQGRLLLGNAPEELAETPDLQRWQQQSTFVATLQDGDGNPVTAARALIKSSDWWVVVEQPTAIAFQSQRRSTLLLGLMLVGTAGLVVLWGLLVAREMTRPILQLRDGVQVLGSGKLGGTIEVARDDELGHLAIEFNRMSERLAESQRTIEQRNMRLSEGLSLARLIQHDLLPKGPPPNSAIAAYAICEPATEIGGDFYTYVPLPDGRVRLVIGDASGKGVAAALVMALTSSLVEIHARQASGPADLLMRLNVELYPRLHTSHMSVSLLVAEFDPHTQLLCAANAGMIAPLVVSGNSCFYVSCFGPPLGVVDSVTYLETTLTLTPEQAVVFVSDGIVEARNGVNEMWGFHHLETTVCAAGGERAEDIVAAVMDALGEHVADNPPADDMTIIAMTLSPHTERDAVYGLVPLADGYVPDVQPSPRGV